jgi:putative two-component system response regulator
MAEPRAARVVVIDDEPANTALLEALLGRWGHRVSATNDSSRALALVEETDPDLILLDLHMPAPDGFAVLAALAPAVGGVPRPVMVLTADTTTETRHRALAAGARDYLTKPFDPHEVRLRVDNLLELRRLARALKDHGDVLDRRVAERTRQLDQARHETLVRLAIAAEYRDDQTGQHAQRVARTAALLAGRLGCDAGSIEMIALAAPLHDVGKIAIPDAILLKPGRLTVEEFEHIKEHVTAGARILGETASPVLRAAAEIALTHHERWDGGGYVRGLRGHEIPLSGRVVAAADVFDALTHERPYKVALPVDEAVEIMRSSRGTHLDPAVVDVFLALDHAALLDHVGGA